jgi:hypothetical protein
MENKEILVEEQIADTINTEVIEENDTENNDYPKTISVKAYEDVVEMTLDETGITAGEVHIKKEDILLVNRYINMRNFKNEPTFTVVYKIDDTTVTSYDFVQNTELSDLDFDDKVAFWLKKEEINFEENDWNYFNPIVNGYLTYRYVVKHTTPEKPKTINALALGSAIAGVLMMIVGGVMLGIGKTIFGCTGLGVGAIALLMGIFNIIKKK